MHLDARVHIHWLVEGDVANAHQRRSLLTKIERSDPGQFQRVPHEEAPEDFVVRIPVLGVRQDQIRDVRLVHVDSARWQRLLFERKVIQVDRAEEQVVDQLLLKVIGFGAQQVLLLDLQATLLAH